MNCVGATGTQCFVQLAAKMAMFAFGETPLWRQFSFAGQMHALSVTCKKILICHCQSPQVAHFCFLENVLLKISFSMPTWTRRNASKKTGDVLKLSTWHAPLGFWLRYIGIRTLYSLFYNLWWTDSNIFLILLRQTLKKVMEAFPKSQFFTQIGRMRTSLTVTE